MIDRNRIKQVQNFLTKLREDALTAEVRKRTKEDLQTASQVAINELEKTLHILNKSHQAQVMQALTEQVETLGQEFNLTGYNHFTLAENATSMEPQSDFPDKWIDRKKAALQILLRPERLAEAFVAIATAISELAAECARWDKAYNKYCAEVKENSIASPEDQRTVATAKSARAQIRMLANQGHLDEELALKVNEEISNLTNTLLLRLAKPLEIKNSHASILGKALMKLHLSCGFGGKRGQYSKDIAAYYSVMFAARQEIQLKWNTLRNIPMPTGQTQTGGSD